MDKIEKELVDYLNKNPKIIEDSINFKFIYYKYIEVIEVSIDVVNESFDVVVETFAGGKIHSCFPLPQKFLRKLKIKQLNK